ncbi:hypothetical protein LEP1GSC170_3022 [Leptospira interrogans serovar Bataviae str. HAI135]|nr:hypothetical protein LEP1GSC170_3022 [Leptospira interrogans serovar Bataviae str. HAI135]
MIETGKLESVRKKAYLGLKGIRISLLNFGKKQELELVPKPTYKSF